MNTHGHTVEEWRKICRANEKIQRQRYPERFRLKKQRYVARNQEKVQASRAAYRVKHRDHILAKKKKWQQDNWAHRQEYMKRYCAANAEKLQIQRKNYYEANKSKVLQAQSEYVKNLPTEVRMERANRSSPRRVAYRKQHLARYTAHAAKRRALKKRVSVDPKGTEKWMVKVRRGTPVPCYYCGTKISGSDIHFDHIVPISNLGKHEIGNLAASCAPCNLSKNDTPLGVWNVRTGQQVLSL